MLPALALFKAARRRGRDATIVTDFRGDAFCGDISEKIVLDSLKFSFKNFGRTARCSASTLFKFTKFYFEKRPNVVVGFGGVFTVIPLLVSKIFGAKIVVYEQNSVVGKANKFLKKIADLKLASFELDENWTRIPAPVREEFVRSVPYKCDGTIKILVVGGSQGAASFCDIIPKALATLDSKERKNIEIVQQESHGNIDKLERIYKELGIKAIVKSFVSDVADHMFDSQLAICRSGASTLSELSASGRPAILIPYPNATDNHQLRNAMHYKNKGAAWVLEEKEEISKELGKIISRVLSNRELLKNAAAHMINDSVGEAADRFVELIELLGGDKK
jgi:UDP-N-acetylglucosamine--N-acetylmuramyl-(pentapeptide) pyrophosphoryl-undecaprenol N-acetylglucosamine transferase